MTKFTDEKLTDLLAQRATINRAIKQRHKELEKIRLRALEPKLLTRIELISFLKDVFPSSDALALVPTSEIHDTLNDYYKRRVTSKRIAALMRELGFERKSKRVGVKHVIKSYQRP